MTSPSPIDFKVLARMIDNDDVTRLREIASVFGRSSARMLVQIQECWARGDMKAVYIAAHGWKGAAKQVGALPLAEALAHLEANLPHAAKALAEVERHFYALSAWLGTIAGGI